jgi:AcrR family transcriptional regulator
VPRKAVLSREQILDAALALVDRDGVGALTVRDLARELGVGTMSLYYHVPDKEALLEGVAERVLADVEVPTEGDWTERARRIVEGLRRAERRHPNALPLIYARRLSPRALLPIEALLGTLREAGFPPREALFAFRALQAFAVGSVIMEPGSAAAAPDGETREDIAGRFAGLPRRDFPYLVEAAEQTARVGPDDEFDHGLDLILEGLRARLRAAATGTNAKSLGPGERRAPA